MNYETIIYEKEDHICTITLNRPHRLNAVSKQLRTELSQALDEIEKDDEIRVVIITGAPRPDGRPCFCPGSDLTEQSERAPILSYEDSGVLDAIDDLIKPDETSAVNQKIRGLPKIVIAAIDGICSAGGLEMALSCDIRIASETAQISDLHMKNLGRIGGGGLTPLLATIVGLAKAKEMVITGDPIDGKEAWRTGLASYVFPPDKLMDGTKELARKIADRNPVAVRMCKAAANATLRMDIDEALRYNYLCRIALEPLRASERAARARDFIEKRKPTSNDSK